MTFPHDRLSGRPGRPAQDWTGRWALNGDHLLDAVGVAQGRDAAQSEDLDAIGSLESALELAVGSGSWIALTDVPLLAGHEDDSFTLQHRERVLAENIASISRVCERFVTRLGERAELLPVSRVKRPARRALERLSAHTEDWAARSLSGPVPRRALAVTREEDADLYENRMVTELVHPILGSALGDRIRRLRRLSSDLADLERARDEGTHFRRRRLYSFWGADAVRAAESSIAAAETLRVLEALAAWIQSLRGSSLGVALRGRRTGQRSLRNTNVIANDRHYRAAGLVWSAYEREPEAAESPDEQRTRFLGRHRTFDHYALGLIIRALDDLGYTPVEDELPMPDAPTRARGSWGDAFIERRTDGVLVLTSRGAATRFVPLLDVVGPSDDHPTVARRWTTLVDATEARSVVLYLAASRAVRTLPQDLAMEMLSAGQDAKTATAPLWGVPVSPLETTSLERVARAVAIALMSPAILDYPAEVRIAGERVPRRLIEHVMNADLGQRGLSPLFHRSGADALAVRRPLTMREQSALDVLCRHLADRAKTPGRERDMATQIGSLGGAILAAATSLTPLLICPLCHAQADTSQVGRDGDVFAVTCRSCEARWGHERCGSCGDRVPIIEPEHGVPNPEVTGPGWVERVYGQDALASPCWARTVAGRYVCTECRSCSLEGTPEGANCARCHPPDHNSLRQPRQ